MAEISDLAQYKLDRHVRRLLGEGETSARGDPSHGGHVTKVLSEISRTFRQQALGDHDQLGSFVNENGRRTCNSRTLIRKNRVFAWVTMCPAVVRFALLTEVSFPRIP